MAFRQSNFRPVGDQIGRNWHWSYHTVDTLYAVRQLGYFNEAAPILKVGQQITVYILDNIADPTILYASYTLHVYSISTAGVVRVTSSKRDAALPTLQSRQPCNAITYFDDFFSGSVGGLRNAVGTTADPGTTTHNSYFGNPQWTAAGTGTNGTAGFHGSDGDDNYVGCLSLSTGTTVGNYIILDLGGRSSGSPGNDVASLGSTTTESVLAWRWQYNSGSDLHVTGIGWVVGFAPGTDWITDPATTFTGTSLARGIVIHRVSDAVYDGDAAGSLVLRTYNGNQTVGSKLTLASSIPTGNADWHKVEIRSSGGILYVYYNETYIGSIPTPTGGDNYRPSIGFKRITSGATPRALRVDYYLQEIESPILR
jgi:hypothetical protein